MTENRLISISRTIYDPAIKDFVTASPDAKALPHIKEWINDHNPVIYWYILRINNPTNNDISQWAVELYAHQALTITEAYIDGSDRRFDLRKERHDPWTEKCVLSVPRQIGIPIVSKGTRRIFFKVDIDCKEGLMHEYGISGAFMAKGMDTAEIKEKMFQYSCKVGEFKQIFDKDPHEASHYAEKRLVGKYSSNSVQVFTNSFRMIHELYGYCHSGSLNRDDLLQKLHLLHASFENVPEIAGERISPLIHDGIRELDVIVDKDKFAPRFIKLCDALVELLHMEVMGAEMSASHIPHQEITEEVISLNKRNVAISQKECEECGSIIKSSNKALECKECSAQFCQTCEVEFRGKRKRGQKILCKKCYEAELKKREGEERQRKEEKERLQKDKDAMKQKKREENDKAKQQRKKQIGKTWNKLLNSLKTIFMVVLALGVLYFVYWGFSIATTDYIPEKSDPYPFPGPSKNQTIYTNSIGMEFVLIPSGEFNMGSPLDEVGRDDDEGPVHTVHIENSYYLGKYEVTQKQWRDIMGTNLFVGYNLFKNKGDDFPVIQISWDDAHEFIRKLNEKEGTDKYRLPSEAEWEYAARAGTNTWYSFGNDEKQLWQYAWYSTNSGRDIHLVGQKKPNPWGLYDMHGNIWEMVQDMYQYGYDSAPSDGIAWEDGSGFSRVNRGGSLDSDARDCRSATRGSTDSADRYNNVGFRLLKRL